MTQRDAERPAEFQEIRQPTTDYIAVPLLSSEDRDYVPVSRFERDIIVNNLVSAISDGTVTTFGLVMSKPFNIWNKAVSGRLESRVRISNTITYNNFPFPVLTNEQRAKIDAGADAVLDARGLYPDSSLSDLYNRDGMPSVLRKAHSALDKVVLAALGLPAIASDEQILETLFGLYSELTRGLLDSEPSHRRKIRKSPA